MGGLNRAGERKTRRVSPTSSLVKWSVASAAIAATPAIGMADYLYTGANSASSSTPYIDGGSWYNGNNWENTSGDTYGTAPVGSTATTATANINAETGFTPSADPDLTIAGDPVYDNLGAVLGAVFNPAVQNPANTTLNLEQLYITSGSSQVNGTNSPNLLTISSGQMEVTKSSSPVIIGRAALGEVTQTGGNFISDITMQVGGDGSNTGMGVINYEGGVLQAGINSSGTSSTTSSTGIRLGNTSGTLGIIHVYNDGLTSSKINLNNLYVGYTSGGMGVLDFIYENGNVKTINVTGGNSNPSDGSSDSQGQLAIRNYNATPVFGTGTDGSGGSIGAVLNLTLAAAPDVTLVGDEYIPQNLALITYADGVHGNSTNPTDFFSPSGINLSAGTTISASYGGFTYDWEIEYAGSVTSVSSEIASDDISGSGGNATNGNGAVVLIGIGSNVPEPATFGILTLSGVGLLARRRGRSAPTA